MEQGAMFTIRVACKNLDQGGQFKMCNIWFFTLEVGNKNKIGCFTL